MPTFIKTGYWDKLSKAPKGYLNLDLITGGGGVTVATKAEIDTLISSNSLVPGAFYEISGVDVPLYGGTTILIQAATTNELTLAGHGVFYNPKYLNSQLTPSNGYGIWQSTETYFIGNDVIWGGKHWTNTSGNVGTSVDKYTLSSVDWTVVPFNSTDYNVEIDIIHYDYLHDMIVRRKDRWDNDVDGNYQWFDEMLSPDGYNFGNPIKDFQWGNGPDDWSTDTYEYIGVYSNYVKDSYLECINFIGSFLGYNTLTEQSYMYNNTADEQSYISYNKLSNYSYFQNNTLIKASSISGNTLTISYLYGNVLNAGTTGRVRISSNQIHQGTLNSNTLIAPDDTPAYQGPAISINNISFGQINNNNITGISGISYNASSGGQINNNTIDGSYIDSNIIDSSSIDNNVINNGSSISVNFIIAASGIGAANFDNTLFAHNKLSRSIFNFSSSGQLSGKEISTIDANKTFLIDNISLATIIYGVYSKQMFNNSAGTARLGYYNASDVFTVVNVNA